MCLREEIWDEVNTEIEEMCKEYNNDNDPDYSKRIKLLKAEYNCYATPVYMKEPLSAAILSFQIMQTLSKKAKELNEKNRKIKEN